MYYIKAIIWLLYSAKYLIFGMLTILVLTGSATLCYTGDSGCCCNPAAAEQNPSWDFMLPSPIPSFLHICFLWSPHDSLFSSDPLCFPRVLSLVFIGGLSVISLVLTSTGQITHKQTQIQRNGNRWAEVRAVQSDNSQLESFCANTCTKLALAFKWIHE